MDSDANVTSEAQKQTELLREIAGNVSTLKSIAVGFTLLWLLGVVIFLARLLG